MSVYHFLQVDFGEGYFFFVSCDGGKQSKLLVLGLRLEFDNITSAHIYFNDNKPQRQNQVI